VSLTLSKPFWPLCLRPRQDLFGYLVLAECRLVLPKAKALQPDYDIHNPRPQLVAAHMMVRSDDRVHYAPGAGIKPFLLPRAIAYFCRSRPIFARGGMTFG
jgi:hypothetical protein